MGEAEGEESQTCSHMTLFQAGKECLQAVLGCGPLKCAGRFTKLCVGVVGVVVGVGGAGGGGGFTGHQKAKQAAPTFCLEHVFIYLDSLVYV